MIKRIIFLLVLSIVMLSHNVTAQEASSLEQTTEPESGSVENGVYVELGGNAGIYSFNYERFFMTDKIKISGRIGFGLFGEGMIIKPEIKKGLDLMIPFGANAVYAISGSHHAEFGLGATFYTYKVLFIETSAANIGQQPIEPSLARNNDFIPNFAIGYRYQKETGGMYYRAFFNGHLTRRVLADDAHTHSQYSVVTLDPWFGISVGYGF
jgi:hypothetical protein